MMRARVDTTSEHAISSADVAVTFKSESTVEFLKIIFQPSSKYLLPQQGAANIRSSGLPLEPKAFSLF